MERMIRPASEANAAIVLAGVEKRFGTTRAVAGLDLVVPRGSLCGFLGPNGAGKSTTIRMIMSIIYPDSGTVKVLDGTALANKDRIGYLPEERGVYRTMKVGEFLVYIARLKGLNTHDAHRRANDWLERLDLRGVAKKKCQELSKGMQQKVQFIAAVMNSPELLILDEPFSGLDPVNSQLLTRVIKELHDAGTTIIFSTHQMPTAEALCDRVVLINHGTKLLDATLVEVRSHYDPRSILFESLDGSDRVMRTLASVPGVATAERSPHDRNSMLVHIADHTDPHDMMRVLLEHAPARSVSIKRTSLTDVFVALVQASGGVAPNLSNISEENTSVPA